MISLITPPIRIKLLFVLGLIFVMQSCSSKKNTSTEKTTGKEVEKTGEKKSNLLRICPEEWIINKMPSADIASNDLPKEYFIIDGVRRELKEFDIVWIEKNCNITPKVVQ